MSGRITPQCGTDLALDFGRGVRTYRQYLGMTIVQLSGEAGVSIGAVSTMEPPSTARHSKMQLPFPAFSARASRS